MARGCQNQPIELLTPREYDLTTNYTVCQLLRMLRERSLKSLELTKAFIHRAKIAHDATNCLTELMEEEALVRARYLDSLEEPLGPLHGLPISVKEHLGMRIYNKSITCSYLAWALKPKRSPKSPMAQILWDAGCVFFARTNQPQTLQCLETNNNVYGRTLNPWNLNLSAGGSSGGEGALIGMRGSLLGLGGDIGGSVRVPAANNSIYGFKPTSKRLGSAGIAGPGELRPGLAPTYGPMAADREAIELFMKVFLDAQPWRLDKSLDQIPWQPVEITRPL